MLILHREQKCLERSRIILLADDSRLNHLAPGQNDFNAQLGQFETSAGGKSVICDELVDDLDRRNLHDRFLLEFCMIGQQG